MSVSTLSWVGPCEGVGHLTSILYFLAFRPRCDLWPAFEGLREALRCRFCGAPVGRKDDNTSTPPAAPSVAAAAPATRSTNQQTQSVTTIDHHHMIDHLQNYVCNNTSWSHASCKQDVRNPAAHCYSLNQCMHVGLSLTLDALLARRAVTCAGHAVASSGTTGACSSCRTSHVYGRFSSHSCLCMPCGSDSSR